MDASSSTNGFNSADPCNPGVGNYLVIKHDDGTFGVYWHMEHNGVLVSVGQKIAQGEEIALSGNTGNSSAPHVHFDARIGWDLAYSCSNLSESPGLPVFFEDRNHSYWRPKVGDTLTPYPQDREVDERARRGRQGGLLLPDCAACPLTP